MKTIHDEITARIIAFINSPNNFLIIKSHVGSGKTTNTLNTLHDEGERWIYLAPFHTVIEENLELSTFREFEYLHLKSRAKMCQIYDYRRLAERGLNIRPICESTCPLKETTCPYYDVKRRLFENPINWAGVHHHIPEFLQDFFDMWVQKQPMYSMYDVLVIDENPINVLFENETANSDQLAFLRDRIDTLSFNHPSKNKVVRLLNYLIETFPGRKDIDYEELYTMFYYIDFGDFYETYQTALIDALIKNQMQIEEVPRDYIGLFSKMQSYATEQTFPYMVMKRKASSYTRKAYYFMCFNNRALIGSPIRKIIGLDGTANVELWESITGREASILDRGYNYHNIYQLSDGRYPLSSWVRNRKITTSGERLCKLIDLIVSTKENPCLLVSTIPISYHLKNNLKQETLDKCKLAHFYYLRSRNDFYETCDTVILTCEPNIPEFQLDCFAELSGWSRDLWRQVFTQEEMIQAVGRIREDIDVVFSRKREDRSVYILSNVNLFDYIEPMNYYDLWDLVENGENIINIKEIELQRLLDLIPPKGNIFLKDLREEAKNHNIRGRKFTDLFHEIITNNKAVQDGRKGIKRIY